MQILAIIHIRQSNRYLQSAAPLFIYRLGIWRKKCTRAAGLVNNEARIGGIRRQWRMGIVWEGKARMNRAETRGKVIALRCAIVVSMEMELTSPLSSKKKEEFSRLSRDEQPVIKFAIVHRLPTAFRISDYGRPPLPYLVGRSARQNTRDEATIKRKQDDRGHLLSSFICRTPRRGTPFIGMNSWKR